MQAQRFKNVKTSTVLFLILVSAVKAVRLEAKISNIENQLQEVDLQSGMLPILKLKHAATTLLVSQSPQPSAKVAPFSTTNNMWPTQTDFQFAIAPNSIGTYGFQQTNTGNNIRIYSDNTNTFNVSFTYYTKDGVPVMSPWSGPYNDDSFFTLPPASNIILKFNNTGRKLLAGQLHILAVGEDSNNQPYDTINITGIVVGIVVGSVAFALIVGGLITFCICRYRKRAASNLPDNKPPEYIPQTDFQNPEAPKYLNQEMNFEPIHNMNDAPNLNLKNLPQTNYPPYFEKELSMLNYDASQQRIQP